MNIKDQQKKAKEVLDKEFWKTKVDVYDDWKTYNGKGNWIVVYQDMLRLLDTIVSDAYTAGRADQLKENNKNDK